MDMDIACICPLVVKVTVEQLGNLDTKVKLYIQRKVWTV